MATPLPVSDAVLTLMQATDQADMQAAIGPQLPQWTYQPSAGDLPTAGGFGTDNANLINTGNITFNTTALDGGTNWGNLSFTFPSSVNAYVMMTNSAGKVILFYGIVTGVADGWNIAGQIEIGDTSGAWAGTYSIAFVTPPSLGAITTVNGQTGAVVIDQSSINTASGIFPCPDGTYPLSATLGGSLTVQGGVLIGFATAS